MRDGLRVVGRSDDGLVEALEIDGSGGGDAFLVAVQWHPEMCWGDAPRHRTPFRLLVEAARRGARRAEARRARS